VKGTAAHTFAFYFDTATERLFIVDAVAHEFSIVSLPDGKRSVVLDSEDLTLPSDIWVDHNGTARIADALRRRIAGVMTESSQFKAFFTDYPGRTAVAREGRYFPIRLVQGPQRNWWVLNADPTLGKADLILYDADGIARQRIDLPDEAEPESLSVFEDRLLVADLAHFRVLSVHLETLTVERFGGKPFVDQGDAFKHRAASYRRISGIALLCMLLFVLFCLLLAWKVHRAQKRPSV
jgi:hypothetical protein